MDVVRLSLISILISMLACFLRVYRQEWASFLMLAAGILLAASVFERFSQLISFFSSVGALFGETSGHLSIIWKSIGIAYLCDFTADVCKDTGNSLLADQISVCGRLAILMLGIPILMTLVQTITGYGI